MTDQCLITTAQLPVSLLLWLTITAFIGWRMFRMGQYLERRKSQP